MAAVPLIGIGFAYPFVVKGLDLCVPKIKTAWNSKYSVLVMYGNDHPEILRCVMEYLEKQENIFRFMAMSGSVNAFKFVPGYGECSFDVVLEMNRPCDLMPNDPLCQIIKDLTEELPQGGKSSFKLDYKREKLESGQDKLTLTVPKEKATFLKFLVCQAIVLYKESLTKEIPVYVPDGMGWRLACSKTPRSLSTIALPGDTLQKLVLDIERFFSPATRTKYRERGIPYRKGYLFYGLPGTGKSSLALAVASHLKRPIYTIVFDPCITDKILQSLFEKIPVGSIILLEDLDTAQVKRAKDSASHSIRPNLTLSGLLNVLDGSSAFEGGIVIATTNYIENIDDALIRPGRFDYRLEFKHCDIDQASQLFRIFYKHSPYQSDFAAKFASFIKEQPLSVAALQQLFLQHEDAVGLIRCLAPDWKPPKEDEVKRVEGFNNSLF